MKPKWFLAIIHVSLTRLHFRRLQLFRLVIDLPRCGCCKNRNDRLFTRDIPQFEVGYLCWQISICFECTTTWCLVQNAEVWSKSLLDWSVWNTLLRRKLRTLDAAQSQNPVIVACNDCFYCTYLHLHGIKIIEQFQKPKVYFALLSNPSFLILF